LGGASWNYQTELGRMDANTNFQDNLFVGLKKWLSGKPSSFFAWKNQNRI
jgi:hypothetical protein